MKKKLLLAGAVALMAAAAVTGYSAYSKSNVPDLLSANVEALAQGESGDVNCSTHCNKRDCGYAELDGTIFTLWWCI